MHKRLSLFFLTAIILFPAISNAQGTLSRTDGLTIIWQGIHRPVEETSESPFSDVQESHPDHLLITFAKARGIVEDGDRFEPGSPLRFSDALLWLFRTRNIDSWKNVRYDTLETYAQKYNLLKADLSLATNPLITQEQLLSMITTLDTVLRDETHTVSYYGADFAGKNTAFGEIFDPEALTAAHLSYPHNTMIRVTNTENGRSVIVRITDRGPYIDGRDMDLSRAAFERISDLSHGVISDITFERLGHKDGIALCGNPLYRRRLRTLLLTPGIPDTVEQGTKITLTGNKEFMIMLQKTPNSFIRDRIIVKPGEGYTIRYASKGNYSIIIAVDGRRRRLKTVVIGGC